MAALQRRRDCNGCGRHPRPGPCRGRDGAGFRWPSGCGWPGPALRAPAGAVHRYRAGCSARGRRSCGRVEDLGGARDLDQALEVIVPGLQAAAGGRPHAHAALLDAVAPGPAWRCSARHGQDGAAPVRAGAPAAGADCPLSWISARRRARRCPRPCFASAARPACTGGRSAPSSLIRRWAVAIS